jgi:hypothetical protein
MNERIDGRAEREMAHAREAMASLEMGAQASLVNRTRRVVRERARQMSMRRDKMRSLWAPLLVCASMLVILMTAVWTLLDEYELSPSGMPDASDQYMVLLFWFLPASAALLAMVGFRRLHNRRSGGEIVR